MARLRIALTPALPPAGRHRSTGWPPAAGASKPKRRTRHGTYRQQHHTDTSELDDTDVARVLRLGAMIGIPLASVIALLISLAGAGWPTAAAIAVWPALMGGPWVGGSIVFIKRLAELDTAAHVTHLPARPVTSPLGHREAA